jgi:hypothetical protein
MTRIVTVDMTLRLRLTLAEGASVDYAIDELDYSLVAPDGVAIEDMAVADYAVVD